MKVLKKSTLNIEVTGWKVWLLLAFTTVGFLDVTLSIILATYSLGHYLLK